MVQLIIVIIIVLIFCMYKNSYKKEKFSNPPIQNDIDYLKNYIKVSKYTLDQASKKISGDTTNKFTTANILLQSIDNKIAEITNANANTTLLNDFYNNYTTSLFNFVKELLNTISSYNNLLGFNTTVISEYNSAVTYINNLSTDELKFKSLIKLVKILKTDLIKVIFNKLIVSNNNISETINLLNPNIDYTNPSNIPINNLDTNFNDLTNINYTTNSDNLSLLNYTPDTTADNLSSKYYNLDLSYLVTGSGTLPRVYT